MRILMINDHFHFGGGGDAVFRLERQAYESEGHEVFTFSQSQSASDGSAERDAVCIEHKSRYAIKAGKFLGAPHVYHALEDLLERIKPNLVRVHLVSKYPGSVYPALKGYPVIQTLHGPNLFCATSWGNLRSDSSDCELGIGSKCWSRGCMPMSGMLLYSLLDWRVTSQVKQTVHLFHCPSRHIQDKAEHLGYGPTLHVPLGIDPAFMNCESATHEGPPTILYVGALVEEKGLLTLPEAMHKVREHVPDVKLVLCGRGALAGRLESEFRARGLADHVEFKGFVDHAAVTAHYLRAHVLVLPSIWAEQFGLVGPEALACGVPCVASSVGGISEWLRDGEWGFLVPPRDATALAARLVKLLSDRDLRLAFGAKGRTFARTVHDPEAYKRRWLDLAASYANAGLSA